MNEEEAYQKAEEYFFKLQLELSIKYSGGIKEAYAKANDRYRELLKYGNIEEGE
jgi:hypothetical protein